MGRFNKGLLLGGAVGAALMWLNATPKGKELRAKIATHLDPLFQQLRQSISQLEGPTKEMYNALVERAVAEYASKKELAEDVKSQLIRQLKKKWAEIEKDITK